VVVVVGVELAVGVVGVEVVRERVWDFVDIGGRGGDSGWRALVLGVVLALEGVGEAREEGDETRELFPVLVFPFVNDREKALGACGVSFCDIDSEVGMVDEFQDWENGIEDWTEGKGVGDGDGKEEVRGGGGG